MSDSDITEKKVSNYNIKAMSATPEETEKLNKDDIPKAENATEPDSAIEPPLFTKLRDVSFVWIKF